MRPPPWSPVAALAGLLALALAQPPSPPGPRRRPPGLPRLARLATDLGAEAFRQMVQGSPERNAVLSPHGLASLLDAVQMAAAGRTRSQVEAAAGYRLNERGVPRALRRLKKALTDPKQQEAVTMADALFVQRGLALRPEFLSRFHRVFGQTVKQVDFGEPEHARGIVNAWVEQHTEGTIRGFLREGLLGQLSRLLLVNAVHFRGQWARPFPEAATRQRLFHKPDGSTVSVPMMEQTAEFNYGEFSTPDQVEYDVVELPYQGEALSMFIATPFEVEAPLSALTTIVDARLIAEWKSNMTPVTRLLVLPKFSLDSEADLRGPLEELGMTDMFDACKANFSSLSDWESLSVAQALQKVKIEVNESGTEASAATAAIIYSRMAPLEIVLDRPFFFVVWHNPTGAVLFMGQVMEP